MTIFIILFLVIDLAQADTNDSLYSYLNLTIPVTYNVRHIGRNISGNHYTNEFTDTARTLQRYSFYKEGPYETFERRQINKLKPEGKYIEKFIWDSIPEWLYPNYLSLEGDKDTSLHCTRKTPGLCDYVIPAGQKWLCNVRAQPEEGNDISASIVIWDASTSGPNSSDYYYDDGKLICDTIHTYYGQIWKRNNWDNAKFRSYPDHVNTAEAIGWNDPGTSTMEDITIAPKYVYIVRQYSDCDNLPGGLTEPWYHCYQFEDHIYAKDVNNNQLAEVMVVIGLTPKYDCWHDSVGDYYAVTVVMIAQEEYDIPLPVTFSRFTAKETDQTIHLQWVTESEIDNLGFILERSENPNGPWQTLASYKTHDNLKGQGNTSSRTEYSYIDSQVIVKTSYYYRLSDVNTTGKITEHSVISICLSETTPKTILIEPFPNPFNQVTTFNYQLPEDTDVLICIYNSLGEEVKTIINKHQQAGYYRETWQGVDKEGRKVSSGIYLLSIETKNWSYVDSSG